MQALWELFPKSSLVDLDQGQVLGWARRALHNCSAAQFNELTAHWIKEGVTGMTLAFTTSDDEWKELVPLLGIRLPLRNLVRECMREPIIDQMRAQSGPVQEEEKRILAASGSGSASRNKTMPQRDGAQHLAVDLTGPASTNPLPTATRPQKEHGASLPTVARALVKREVLEQQRVPPKVTKNGTKTIINVDDDDVVIVSFQDDQERNARLAKNTAFWQSAGLQLVREGIGWADGTRLRAHQDDVLTLLTQGKALIVKAPTGSGKTNLLLRIARTSAALEEQGPMCPYGLSRVLICVVLPHIVGCESVWSELPMEWKGDYASRAFGSFPNGVNLTALQSGRCRLFVSTIESIVRQEERLRELFGNMREQLGGRHIVFVMDEADAVALDDIFREMAKGVSIVESLADEVWWLTATGSPGTLRHLNKMLKNPAEVHNIGPQGLDARQDIDFRVVPFTPVVDVEKSRNEKIVDLLTREPERHKQIVFVRKMRSGPAGSKVICKEVVQLTEMLKARNFKTALLHAGLESPQRNAALKEFAQGNCVLIGTEMLTRLNVLDAHTIVMAMVPSSTEQFVQLAGRVHRAPSQATIDAGIEKGAVYVIFRPEDHHLYFDKHADSVDNSPSKKNAIQVMSTILQSHTCILSNIQQAETGLIAAYPNCSCPACIVSRGDLRVLPDNYRTWYLIVVNAVAEIETAGFALQFTSTVLVAKYIAGSQSNTIMPLVAEMGETAQLYASGREELHRSKWDALIRAMLKVQLLRQDGAGPLYVTECSKQWITSKEPAKCHAEDLAVLVNFKRSVAKRMQVCNFNAAAAVLDVNKNVASHATAVQNALAVSKVVVVEANQYGDDLPRNAGGGEIFLLHSQALIVRGPRDILEATYDDNKRMSPSKRSALLDALCANQVVAAFLGAEHDNWAFSIGTCVGVKKCSQLMPDGSPCSTIDVLMRQQPCASHPNHELEKADCGARTLFAWNDRTRQSVVLPLDRHPVHGDLAANKVPLAVVNKLGMMCAADPHLKAGDVKCLQFDALDGGRPLPLLSVCPAFVVKERLEDAVRRLRNGRGEQGAAAAVEYLAALSKDKKYAIGKANFAFLRAHVLRPDPTDPQVILVFSDLMLANLVNGSGQVECDGTFCTVRHVADEPKWEVYNGATVVEGRAEFVFHALLNGRRKANYKLFFVTLFNTLDTCTANSSLSQCFRNAYFDFEKGELAGLREACLEYWPQEPDRLKDIVRFCSVHWKRIGTKRSKSIPVAERDVFLEVFHHASEAASSEQARLCITLLKHDGIITAKHLIDCGIPPITATKVLDEALTKKRTTELAVSWSRFSKRWADTLLKEKNAVVIAGLVNPNPGTRSTNHVESRQGSSGLQGFKNLPGNSQGKTPLVVLEYLFVASYNATLRHQRDEEGQRTSHRSQNGLELRNVSAEKKESSAKRSQDEFENSAATLVGQAKKKKVKGADRKTCLCKETGCRNGWCSCFKKYGNDGTITCGHGCTCKCEIKREKGAPEPPLLAAKPQNPPAVKLTELLKNLPVPGPAASVAPAPVVPVVSTVIAPIAPGAAAVVPAPVASVVDDLFDLEHLQLVTMGHLDVADEELEVQANAKKRERTENMACPVCNKDSYEASGDYAAIQCTLVTQTKTCCYRYFHMCHTGLGKVSAGLFHCNVCASGCGSAAQGARKSTRKKFLDE